MKKLIINNLYIYSLKEKKAFHAHFEDCINFVTASHENGNKRGKSVILKNIYNTLGADCNFDPSWEFENKTTILDINVDNTKYYIVRFNNLFRIVDSIFKTIFTTTQRIELSEKLKEIFDFYVELPNRANKLELTPPAYMYLLNYADQSRLSCTKFDSFANLGQYANFKKYALLSHFGIFNDKYYNLDRNLRKKKEEIEKIDRSIEIHNQLTKKIETELSGCDYSYDNDSLNDELKIKENEYREIVKDLSKTKKNIIKLQNNKIEIENLLDDLKKDISDNDKNFKNYAAETCPYCKSHIDPFKFSYQYYDKSDDFLYIRQSLTFKLDELKHSLTLKEKEYKNLLKIMTNYNNEIKEINSNIDDIAKHKGLVEIKSNLSKDIYIQNMSKITITNQISELNKKIKKYQAITQDINNEYHDLMKESCNILNLKEIKEKNIKSIDCTFNVGGSAGPMSTIAWYLNLLKIKSKHNPNAIKFPVVLDSPNNAELDEYNLSNMFKFILNNVDKNSQVIISTIEYSDKKYKDYNISNVITLTNEKNELLSKKEYSKNIDFYKKVMNLY